MQQTKLKGLTSEELDQLAINTIRTLSIDAVQQANSGHPGTPMALAPLVYTIWNRVLRFDPQDPIWPNRDRFVLSNGHASMLLWSVLYLTGTRAVNADYESVGKPSVTLDDIRQFRQLTSKAPGHPEYHWVSGVETTTGPLGQGIATSVGMAIARKRLASGFFDSTWQWRRCRASPIRRRVYLNASSYRPTRSPMLDEREHVSVPI
jgi:transketolase